MNILYLCLRFLSWKAEKAIYFMEKESEVLFSK